VADYCIKRMQRILSDSYPVPWGNYRDICHFMFFEIGGPAPILLMQDKPMDLSKLHLSDS
jgi:hypothetical protein